VEDRGFQFADSVYEVWAVLSGRLADADRHFARLFRNLAELGIESP
jgi:D-alanine transaminase